MDAFQHVNNTVYFRYFESCRIDYFMKLLPSGFGTPGSIGPILKWASCDFRYPVTFPDTIHVGARISNIKADRFDMSYLAISKRHDRPCAIGESIIVVYDYSQQCKASLPKETLELIEKIEKAARKS